MSTRSTVSLLTKENTVKSIYVHWDGYLSHNGKILLSEYQNYEDVLRLVSYGSRSTLPKLSELEPDGENDSSCTTYSNIIQWHSRMINGDRQEYNYIFVFGCWYLFTPSQLLPLQDTIDATVEEDGTERRQFSDDELYKLGRILLEKLMLPGRIIATYGNRPEIRLADCTTIDMHQTLYEYKFVDSIGFASIMASDLKEEEERNARKRQCQFKPEDCRTLALAKNYRNTILGYDRATYALEQTKDEYFDYFINLVIADQLGKDSWLEGVLDEELERIKDAKKGYVAKKIVKLVSSMPVSDKKYLTDTFCRPAQSRGSEAEEYHVYLLEQYLSNLGKYGHGYADEMEMLQSNPIYLKLCKLDEELSLKCKDCLFDQISSLEKCAKTTK